MEIILVTAATVGVMLLYSVPGYIVVKCGKVKKESIPSFAGLLMYVCQPCLAVYCFGKVEYSAGLMKDMGLFFLITLILMGIPLVLFYTVMKKFGNTTENRISAVSMALGNCTFMGVPLLEAIMPEYTEGVILSNIFFVAMSTIGWTVASYMITQDKKHISLKNIILNPGVIGAIVSIGMLVLGIRLPNALADGVALIGRMSTPLCMMVLGMRLASVSAADVFNSPLQYIASLAKLLVFPCIALLIAKTAPIPTDMARTLFILSCAPSAAVVLTFAELLGEGQKTAANIVLLSTILSVITIPCMMLLQ